MQAWRPALRGHTFASIFDGACPGGPLAGGYQLPFISTADRQPRAIGRGTASGAHPITVAVVGVAARSAVAVVAARSAVAVVAARSAVEVVVESVVAARLAAVAAESAARR